MCSSRNTVLPALTRQQMQRGWNESLVVAVALRRRANRNFPPTQRGGSTGDIEGLPFLEAIRQFILEVGAQNVVNIHVTLVPYIKAARELKTKPTQQSVAKLREIGLQPQVLICRSEKPLEREVRRKLSMFCSVSERAVIEARDVEHTVYEVPLLLHAEGLDRLICDLLHLQTPEP